MDARADAYARKAEDLFVIFEHKEGTRLVQEKDLPLILRGMGLNPSAEQLSDAVEAVTAGLEADQHLIPLEAFVGAVLPWIAQNERALARDDFHKLMTAFKAFDADGRGFVTAAELEERLVVEAGVLTSEECAKMLSHCADSEGRLWYEDYAMELAQDGSA